MKLIIIPPYKGAAFDFNAKEGPWHNELVANMRKKGQLEGVEIDIDEGYPATYTGENRDEEVLAYVSVGLIKKVREYSEMGKYDAIVTSGTIEPGFFAARMVSKIPIACAVHSAVHVASLIGNRFSLIEMTDAQAQIVRRRVDNYGLSHMLTSVRNIERSSTYAMELTRKYKKEERSKVPEVKKFINDIVAQCVTAIEKERVDSIILGCAPLQLVEDEVRQGLDELGYEEIQLICELSAAVEMAKAMVSMKLIQAPRAYPSDSLKAKPEFR